MLDGVSAFPRSCFPLSPIVSPHMSACVGWRVRLPEALSPLASPCLPLPPHMCACVGWRARLPRVLSPIASPHVCLCWMVRPPSQGLVSPCLPLSICLPLSPHMGDYVGWCVRLPEVLSPLVSPHVCLCWMVWPPSRSLVSPCLPLSPIVAHVFLCWNVFAFPRSCLPIVSPHMCACVGCCVCLRKFLSSLASHCLPMPPIALIVSHCLPTCVPVLDGVFAFPRCACVGPHSRALVSSCLPHVTCVHVLDNVPTFLRFVSPCLLLPPNVFPCLALSPFLFSFAGWCVRGLVSPLVSLCWMVCPPFRGPLSPLVSLLVSLCWMVCPPSRGLVFPCLPTCVPVLDGVFASPKSCQPWSPIVSPHGCLCCCPPSRSLDSSCLAFSPHTCACVGRRVRLP